MEARRALEVLEDPQKRAQFIDTLRAIAKAPPPAPEAAAQPSLALEPNSLGAQLLSQLSGWSDRLSAETAAAADALSDLPLLWRRFARTIASPALQKAFLTFIWQLALVIGSALLLEWLAGLALRRPLAGLAVFAPENGAGPSNNGIAATRASRSAGAWRLRELDRDGLLHAVPLDWLEQVISCAERETEILIVYDGQHYHGYIRGNWIGLEQS